MYMYHSDFFYYQNVPPVYVVYYYTHAICVFYSSDVIEVQGYMPYTMTFLTGVLNFIFIPF